MKKNMVQTLLICVALILVFGFANCGDVNLAGRQSGGSTGALFDNNPPVTTYPDCGEVLPNYTWQNIDEFQLLQNQDAEAKSAAFDSLGNLFVVGHAVGLSTAGGGGPGAWLVRKFDGTSWSIVDAFRLSTDYGGGNSDSASDIVIDSNNNIYVIGTGFEFWTTNHWLVRKSSDHGASWTTIDDYRLGAAQNSYANGQHLFIDNQGNLLATGLAVGSDSNWHSIIRKRPAGSSTWSTVLDVPATPPTSYDFYPLGGVLAQDTAGNLFLSQSWQMTHEASGHVRIFKSTNGGTSWSGPLFDSLYTSTQIRYMAGALFVFGWGDGYVWRTRRAVDISQANLLPEVIDSFNCATTNSGDNSDLVVDATGTHYFATGTGQTISGSNYLNHIVTRVSHNKGLTWNSVDYYTGPSNEGAESRRIILGPGGRPYVIGNRNSGGHSVWMVRKLVSP